MKRRGLLRSGVAMAGAALALAAAAWGQVRVEGISHAPMGTATLSPQPDGSLRVENLGSSGQDGVSLLCDSGFGASMSLSIDELLAPLPLDREMRIRPRGWDGTIKGSLRLSSRPPDGSPGSSMDIGCSFAQAGALHIRVIAEDSVGNAIYTAVMPASSVQCTASVVSPPGTQLSCRLAIKTKGTSAHRTQQLSVTFPEGPWTISGLSTAALHEVSVLTFEPEQCAACDTWLGTESVLVTGAGVSSMTLSRPRLLTFGVSSSATGDANVDEDCDDASDCDDVRALSVSNLDASLGGGVVIVLDGDGNGGSFSLRRHELMGHVILMKAVDDEGTESSRLMLMDSPATGGERVLFDAQASGATEVDLHLLDSSGTVLHSSREPTAVIAMACTGGPDGSPRMCTCPPGHWRMTTQTPDTYILPNGTPVAGVSSVSFTPVLASPPAPVHALHVLGNTEASPIVIRPVNDPPARIRVGGIIAVAMDKGLISEQADGSVVVSSPCCIDADSDGDGLELLYQSSFGGQVVLDIASLQEPSTTEREIRIRPKGWDGTVKGSIRMSGGGGGAGGQVNIDCDFAEMGAVEMRWVAYDAEGAELASGIAPGSSVGCTATPLAGLEIPTCSMAINRKGPPGQHRLGGTMTFGGGTVTLGGLGGAPVDGVSVFGFTPIECAACSRFADIESMQVTYGGMSSMTVLGASLLSLDAECVAVGGSTIGEVCDDQDDDCDSPSDERRLEVRNLGSSGQDGVELRFGNPLISEVTLPVVDGASFEIATNGCCKGHVTVLKSHDDGGGIVSTMTSSSSADGTSHTLAFDSSAVGGATGATLHIMNANGDVLRTVEYGSSIGDISYVGPCDASEARHVAADSGGFEVELCEADVTVFAGGQIVPEARSVMWAVDASPPVVTFLRMTSDATEGVDITGLVVNAGEPPCAADFNGDGARDVPDIFAFLSAWFAQDPRAYNFGGQTGVPAIFAFLSTWFAGCP